MYPKPVENFFVLIGVDPAFFADYNENSRVCVRGKSAPAQSAHNSFCNPLFRQRGVVCPPGAAAANNIFPEVNPAKWTLNPRPPARCAEGPKMLRSPAGSGGYAPECPFAVPQTARLLAVLGRFARLNGVCAVFAAHFLFDAVRFGCSMQRALLKKRKEDQAYG